MAVLQSTSGTIAFSSKIEQILSHYDPCDHIVFLNLAEDRNKNLTSIEFLNELYIRYQAAMHATRVMAYHIPHLDSIEFRMAKFRIIADDDGDPGGDSHHLQLKRTWIHMLGQRPKWDDIEFGDLESLASKLEPVTANFVSKTQELFPQSLGPWLIVEGLSHSWIGALLKALSFTYPNIANTPYFINNYLNEIELKHAKQSIDTVSKLIYMRPDLEEDTIKGAIDMGENFNSFWDGMQKFVDGN